MIAEAIDPLRSAPVVLVQPAERGNSLDATMHLRRASDGLLLSEGRHDGRFGRPQLDSACLARGSPGVLWKVLGYEAPSDLGSRSTMARFRIDTELGAPETCSSSMRSKRSRSAGTLKWTSRGLQSPGGIAIG